MSENTYAWPSAAEIVDEFWRRSGHPSQSALDTLINDMGIPVSALASSTDGCDFPIGTFKVDRGRGRDRGTFTFTDDESVKPVLGFVAWDRWAEAHDLVGWSPKDDWTGTWLGRAAALNEFEAQDFRIGDRLRVFLHVGDWLRTNRQGLVVVDKDKSARLLEGLTVEAFDLAEGVELRKILERPRAKIVVPAAPQRQVAA